jgi:NADH-quinone oxidoreductase subunit E
MDVNIVDEIVLTHMEESARIVPILQDVQRHYHYLPEGALRHVAGRLRIPCSRVYAVANFYGAFSLKPRGKHLVRICMGTACHLRGSPKLMDLLASKFKVEDGGTSSDGAFSVEAVNCLGACALAPVVSVDGKYLDGVSPDKLLRIIKKF